MSRENDETILIAIFPYIRISEPVTIRSIKFLPSQLLEENLSICELCRSHLRELLNLFYWHDNTQINEMMYTQVHFQENTPSQSQAFFRRLEETRILLGYICCSPDERNIQSSPIGHYELADLFVFQPTNWVSRSLVHCAELSSQAADDQTGFIKGYEFNSNFNSLMWATAECRIYPQWISHGKNQFELTDVLKTLQFLRSDLSPDVNWEHLFDERKLTPALDETLFRAMEWYNRSCQMKTTSDLALVYLAVAFETLLGIDSENDTNVSDVTRRLWDSIRVLVGSIPRLRSWFEQFYHARSRILHEGHWSHLRFYLIDDAKFQSSKLRRSVHLENAESYGYLIQYGMLIFRICFNAVAAGFLKTSQINLQSVFFNNQERLISIKKDLEAIENGNNALYAIMEHVRALYRNRFEIGDNVQLQTVVEVGKLLVSRFQEIGYTANTETRSKFDAILLENQPAHRHYSHQVIKQKLLVLFEGTNELPHDIVIEPALESLRRDDLSILEIQQNLQVILKDTRNSQISASLRQQLTNVVDLISDLTLEDDLKSIASLSTGKSGDFIHEHEPYSILDAFAQFTNAMLVKIRVRWNLLD